MSDNPETSTSGATEKAVQTEPVNDESSSTVEEEQEQETKEPVDPADVALPRADTDEGNFHDETLLEEEELHERISIPSSFAARYLHLHSASASEPSNSSSSPSTPKPSLPSSLLLEAQAAIQSAFSLETQIASIASAVDTSSHPKLGQEYSFRYDESASAPSPSLTFKERLDDDRPMFDEPIITFYCPYDHTPGVIDTLVESVGESEGCDVLVLDPVVLAQGGNGDGPLGAGELLSLLPCIQAMVRKCSLIVSCY